jgi:NADH-quinone oxidoreductase subunit N
MSGSDFIAILPLLVIAAGALLALGLAACWRRHGLIAGVTAGACVLAFGTVPLTATQAPRSVTPLLIVDELALLFLALLLGAGLIVTALSHLYLKQRAGALVSEEFYPLLLLALLGAMALVCAQHMASFFLGLELLSVSLYGLIAYRRSGRGIEAGVKYLILSGASSAFLLFGMALLYFHAGTLEFSGLASPIHRDSRLLSPFVFGLMLLLTGIGFKLAVAPFHMWAPDVYEGAPAPVTAFVATVSKGAVFALLLRFFLTIDGSRFHSVVLVLAVIAAISMIVGTFLALLQENVKRLLACSSIAHLGFLLVALLAGGGLAVEAAAFYLLAYFISILGAFGIMTVLSGRDREAETLADYRGLFWRHPWLAAVFTAMLLSLAGIPLTAGFLGKFYAVAAGLEGGLWALVLLLVLNSAIGIFYYLRVVVAMAGEAGPLPVLPGAALSREVPWTGNVVLAVLMLLLFWLGTYPAPFIHLIQNATIESSPIDSREIAARHGSAGFRLPPE